MALLFLLIQTFAKEITVGHAYRCLLTDHGDASYNRFSANIGFSFPHSWKYICAQLTPGDTVTQDSLLHRTATWRTQCTKNRSQESWGSPKWSSCLSWCAEAIWVRTKAADSQCHNWRSLLFTSWECTKREICSFPHNCQFLLREVNCTFTPPPPLQQSCWMKYLAMDSRAGLTVVRGI